jgi:hypothetical protein
LANVPHLQWGSHFAHFFGAEDELGEVLVPYFQAGLANNERCLWVTGAPFGADCARAALRVALPDLDKHERDGQIEIIDGELWYSENETVQPEALIADLLQRERDAVEQGYAGLRTLPELARAFWFDSLVDAAIFREWTVNLGRRNSHERTAHLLLELAALHAAVGLLHDDTFDLPVTQSDLSDALGMTAVHLNRVLQSMRGDRLIRTHSRSITIENRPELEALAGFHPGYLRPEGQLTDVNLTGWFQR